MVKHVFLLISAFALAFVGANAQNQQVEEILSKMTLHEKIAMIHAQSKFSSPGVPRLGIPELWMSDGPHGIRAEVLWDEWYGAGWTSDSCIAFPALTCLAATWNPEISHLYGKSIGEEARYRNKNVLLGPGVNIYRTPLNGRNFEYMGEDPYLSSQMVVPYIQGVQENGVAACVKHFALNNQEKYRGHINVIVGERALREIYLPAFKAAVTKGKAWAIMGSYNQYMNQHCCHNDILLNKILRGEWKFDGVVISDWGGVHDTRQAALNGLDMEFGTWTDGLKFGKSNAYDSYYMADPYLNMIKKGELSEKELNDKVRRILLLELRTNLNSQRPHGSFGTQEHADAGRQIQDEGIVLLKNSRAVLPLGKSVKHLLVVGENAVKPLTIGGGSSSLKVKYEISPLEGIRRQAGSDVEVTYIEGYRSPKVAAQDVKGATKPKDEVIDDAKLRSEAVKAAKKADAVIFIGGLNKNEHEDCEGADRQSLGLPYHQDEVISALAKANKNFAVVILSGNAVAMPWISSVPSVVEAWYGGTSAGNAIADVLFGKVNPSGKLPFTFYKDLSQTPQKTRIEYPGDSVNVRYDEGIYVGYRYIDKQNLKPLFPFGYGLSYTTFSYGKLQADKNTMTADGKITFSMKVKNTGRRAGAEVIQLYIHDSKSSLPRPEKELKGFQKVYLNPGEEKSVSITIDKDALSYYDDRSHQWVAEPGEFVALAGTSSQNIKDSYTFTLK
jgi:beta-glucosidase